MIVRKGVIVSFNIISCYKAKSLSFFHLVFLLFYSFFFRFMLSFYCYTPGVYFCEKKVFVETLEYGTSTGQKIISVKRCLFLYGLSDYSVTFNYFKWILRYINRVANDIRSQYHNKFISYAISELRTNDRHQNFVFFFLFFIK